MKLGLAMSLCLSVPVVAATPPSAKDVARKLDERHSRIVDIRFEYEVHSNVVDFSVRGRANEDDRTFRHTHEELAYLKSTDADRPLSWVSWIAYSEVQGRTPIAFFWVFNGKTHHKFQRSQIENTRRVPYNAGQINAGYDNLSLTENHFERILFLKLNGSSQNWDAMRKSDSSKGFQFVKETEFLGRKGCLFERIWIPGKLKKTSVVLDGPAFLVASHKTVEIPSEKVVAEFRVDELSEFEGLLYPSKGRYVEPGADLEYSFAVSSVTKLNDSNRKDWFPVWPRGTRVNDAVGGKHFIVER